MPEVVIIGDERWKSHSGLIHETYMDTFGGAEIRRTLCGQAVNLEKVTEEATCGDCKSLMRERVVGGKVQAPGPFYSREGVTYVKAS